MRFAAAIEPELHRYLVEQARDPRLSIAEINRRVGARAEALGLPRPSYAGVRLLVGDERMLVRVRENDRSWADIALGIAFRTDHPDVISDKLTGLLDKHLPEDHGIR